MRPGYDRVSADTRRPPIPDLPIDSGLGNAARSENHAATVVGAVFALMLTIGVAVAFLYGPLNLSSASVSSAVELPQKNR